MAGAAALAIAGACTSGTPVPRTMPPAPPVAPASPVFVRFAPSEAEIRAIAEILLMEDRRELEAERIGMLTAHWSPQVRRRAALALGRVRTDGSVATLLELLEDPEIEVRMDAAFALGLLADSSAATIHALAGLARLHPADSLGSEAVAALAKAGSAEALDSLSALIESAPDGIATPVVAEALVSLWRFGQRAEAALGEFTRFARHVDPAIRWRAIYPLSRNGIAAAGPLFLELAADADPAVRALAVRALRVPGVDSAGIRGAALSALRLALGDAHPHVRINALGALATYRDPALAPDIAPMLTDPDGNVRMAALQASAATGVPSTAGDLERVASSDSDRIGIRMAALGALVGQDTVLAVSIAKEWARSGSWLERLTAARTLGSAPWPQTRDALFALAADEDARVARAAIGAASRVADAESGQALFLNALSAPDARVRAAAIGAIARRGSTADLVVLLDAYALASSDTVTDAAIAAVNGLATLGRNGSPVANVFFARFAPHPSAAVRRAVARQLGDQWGVVADEGPQRGLAFYEDVIRSLVVPTITGDRSFVLRITTPSGPIDIELAAADAPLTVHNIITLVESGYYDARGDPDARRWHRVVPNFVLQDGEPSGDGSGNSGYSIRDEINRIRYGRGVLGMALSGPDTGGGQFFITHSPQPHLDGGYTIFGRVVNGMAAADAVVQDDRILGMEIIRR
jgi:cyclophilin family peptidyl-prolyl cis-trans isomerase/HEAT repeat protein